MAQHLAFGISVLLLAIASSYFIQQFFKCPVEHRSNSEKVAERTSWLCSGNVSTDRVCRFKNLCYSSRLDKFVAIGVSSTEEKSLMKSELGEALSLTSVVDMKYTCDIVSSSASAIQNGKVKIKFMDGKYLIFARFVEGNLGHFIHDEMIPIYQTLFLHHKAWNPGAITLMLFDRGDVGTFRDLYSTFTDNPILQKVDLSFEEDNTITCFEDAIVGLSKETVWFKYDFVSPEGPVMNTTATWEHINNFTEHVRARLAIYPNCNGDDFGIIFRRKTNRIIVNEDEIIRAISEEFGLKIIATSLEENSLTDLIEKASCAKLMIGVHGALLMLMIFLQPQSVVLELFPYGIIPDYKSQYKTLASLPGSNIEYVRWRNMDETNTVTHPENERYFGGIAHLQKETQNKIIESSEVSPKKRLSNPEWRFRLYQDTIVDIPAITKLLGGTYLRKGTQTRKDQSRFFDLIGSVYVFTVRAVKQLMSKTSPNSQLNTNRKRALKTTVITYGN
ncbi:hypothetical protein BSL78_24666 [Apostichopus japonicus]|uniref:Glycosyltransferase 61 catalytic domain-containing protein n=1 Tax=Stichopus japonicus TaxID=307972 RepID=A0A2G8JRY8_STIJA|nr:hypothetical protein BSL78_24666 [Apostichopus japonicus]